MLPALSSDERKHSERVVAHIASAVQDAGGFLSFADFMQLALYAPGLGYYSAGARKLGRSGDFTTAPESSRLFGRCVARCCAELLEHARGDILETGAGSGVLAADILVALAALDTLPDRYLILEVSADLRERQRARLATLPGELASRVHWLDTLQGVRIDGLVLANEVLDALAFERFAIRQSGPKVIGVCVDSNAQLRQAEAPATGPLAEALAALERELDEPLPVGYVSELNLRARPWIAALGDVVRRGAVLAFDYGLPRRQLYHAQRTRGTLRCHFRQIAHDDPLLNPGLQDITAWVDFTTVAEAAVSSGLDLAGFCTQAAFLLATGIEADVAAASSDRDRVQLAGEARRLLLPGEMGEAFKAIALTRDCDGPLSAFRVQDLRRQL